MEQPAHKQQAVADLLRRLPSVNQLVERLQRGNGQALPHAVVVGVVRDALDEARHQLARGDTAAVARLQAVAAARLAALHQPSLRPLINASGVIIQTNLGRAPLSVAARAAIDAVAAGYANLEYDLAEGERGSRHSHLNDLLCRLTGAEAALVVNNAAAALYLVLMALAQGREVIVSRGQAVEIGGGFRIPDVLAQSGAQLVEVGTTNRTYARDYAAALNERTALLLRVHTSNFRLVGFVHETPLAELAQLGRAHGVPLLDDLGSGSLLPTQPYGLAGEPTVQASVRDGADLVVFSGDKLLGGPQAGLIVGRAALIAQLKRHPLVRALRVDKLTIAGLEATLRSYLRGHALDEIPVWRMIAAPPEELRARAEGLAPRVPAELHCAVVACQSTVGGGALPGETLPSYGLALGDAGLDELATRLRQHTPAVVGRINAGRLLLDLRTVLPEQETDLVAALQAVVSRVKP
jgi:L-seryl-tRNA(Ser) seleniumtransferase